MLPSQTPAWRRSGWSGFWLLILFIEINRKGKCLNIYINQEVRSVYCRTQGALLCSPGLGNDNNCFGKYAKDVSNVLNQVEESGNIPDMDRIWIKGWFPILFELSCIVSRCTSFGCCERQHLTGRISQVQAGRADERSYGALWHCQDLWGPVWGSLVERPLPGKFHCS